MSGLIPVNLVFFMLMAVGGASMAVVDGVAGDWQTQIFILWALFNAPYLYFVFLQMRAKKNTGLRPATEKAMHYTNWLALPGAMCVFFLVGSGSDTITKRPRNRPAQFGQPERLSD